MSDEPIFFPIDHPLPTKKIRRNGEHLAPWEEVVFPGRPHRSATALNLRKAISALWSVSSLNVNNIKRNSEWPSRFSLLHSFFFCSLGKIQSTPTKTSRALLAVVLFHGYLPRQISSPLGPGRKGGSATHRRPHINLHATSKTQFRKWKLTRIHLA